MTALFAENDLTAFSSWPAARRAEFQDMVSVLDEIALQFHLSVGGVHDGTAAPLSPEQERLFREALPMLEKLTTAGFSQITHHLIQMLEAFIPVDPPETFRLIAHAVSDLGAVWLWGRVDGIRSRGPGCGALLSGSPRGIRGEQSPRRSDGLLRRLRASRMAEHSSAHVPPWRDLAVSRSGSVSDAGEVKGSEPSTATVARIFLQQVRFLEAQVSGSTVTMGPSVASLDVRTPRSKSRGVLQSRYTSVPSARASASSMSTPR